MDAASARQARPTRSMRDCASVLLRAGAVALEPLGSGTVDMSFWKMTNLAPDASASLETPSGKSAGNENFQVGSWLLPAALRPHVAAFYAFVRAADDIGDNPALAPDDKIARLDAFERALTGPEEAAATLP